MNSKKILRPFFQNVAFDELEILCDHVPRWFEQELPSLKLRAEIETTAENLLKVKVVPQGRE